ncbi:MAG: ARPP-1 family domain-containing protein, partial [Armatimonadota bacterium]
VAFKAGGIGGHVSLRAVVRVTESQSVVWSEVERKRSALGVQAEPSGTLVSVQRDESVQRRIKPYRESPLARLPAQIGRDTVGVVVFVGGKPKAADVFGSHELLRRLWSKLLDSYAMDAVELKERAKAVPVPDAEDARRFLRRALSASATSRETPGVGELISLRSSEITGQALIHESKLVHLELFPRGALIDGQRYRSPYRVVPRQMPEPFYPPRRVPRIR